MKHKKPKATYRLRNWREYNRALVQRGSLTMWLNADLVATWRHRKATGKRGPPRLYTETAIVTMATLQGIYHLPLRQTEGLLRSLLAVLHVGLPVPDYSTLSRRRTTLEVALPRTRRRAA